MYSGVPGGSPGSVPVYSWPRNLVKGIKDELGKAMDGYVKA